MSESGEDPPRPGEVPVASSSGGGSGQNEFEDLGSPEKPDEKRFNIQKAEHDARVEIMRKIFYVFAGVIFLVAILVLYAVISPPDPNIPDGSSPRELAELIVASVLPAIVGLLGSVVGFYFGRQTNEPPGGA